MIDLVNLAKGYGLPDMGLDDPRIEPFIEATFARYCELAQMSAEEGAEGFLLELAKMNISTRFLAELGAAGGNAAELSDSDLTLLIENATDTAMVRHFDAKKRYFPTRLASTDKAQIRTNTTSLINRLPEARRTGATDSRHTRRIAQAARLVANQIITVPLTPETVFKIEDMLVEEVIYAAARKSLGFMEVGDAELVRMTEAARDAKSAKIRRFVQDDI